MPDCAARYGKLLGRGILPGNENLPLENVTDLSSLQLLMSGRMPPQVRRMDIKLGASIARSTSF